MSSEIELIGRIVFGLMVLWFLWNFIRLLGGDL